MEKLPWDYLANQTFVQFPLLVLYKCRLFTLFHFPDFEKSPFRSRLSKSRIAQEIRIFEQSLVSDWSLSDCTEATSFPRLSVTRSYTGTSRRTLGTIVKLGRFCTQMAYLVAPSLIRSVTTKLRRNLVANPSPNNSPMGKFGTTRTQSLAQPRSFDILAEINRWDGWS